MTLYNKINRLVANNNFLPDVMQGTDDQVIIKYVDGPKVEESSDFCKLYLLIRDRLRNKEELYNYAEVKTTGENIEG